MVRLCFYCTQFQLCPHKAPHWTTCLATDFTIYAISGPQRSKGITLGTTWLWQEVGPEEFEESTHKDRESEAGVASPIVAPQAS